MKEYIPLPGSTKEKILSSALETFTKQRFEDTNIHEIAKNANVTTGAIYHHFGSKSKLLDIIKREVEQRIVDRMEGVIELFDTPFEKIEAALKTGLDFVIKKDMANLFTDSLSLEANKVYLFIEDLCGETKINGLGPVIYSAWISIVDSIINRRLTIEEGKNLLSWLVKKN
ncbi:TetR/AcrR family transcriptional regulator [Alkalihalobacillus sp. FSL W8-0930]